eukprot:1157024-Pelagomonas_calceolata.AAC.8
MECWGVYGHRLHKGWAQCIQEEPLCPSSLPWRSWSRLAQQHSPYASVLSSTLLCARALSLPVHLAAADQPQEESPLHLYVCRPKNLLVLINPFSGAKRSRVVWEQKARPVFEKAHIKYTLVETLHAVRVPGLRVASAQ